MNCFSHLGLYLEVVTFLYTMKRQDSKKQSSVWEQKTEDRGGAGMEHSQKDLHEKLRVLVIWPIGLRDCRSKVEGLKG